MMTMERIAEQYAGTAFAAWLACACALGLAVAYALDASRAGPAGRARLMAALTAFGVVLFAVLAINVVMESRLVAFDNALAETIARHASSDWLRALSALTVLGNRDFLIALGTAVFLVLLWRRRRGDAALWVAGALGAALLNVLLKHIFQRVRPEHLHGFAHELGWSFPSGHASGAMSVYGLLAYLLAGTAAPGWRKVIAMVAAGLIASIGYSRVILQVHFLSDVIAAFAISGAWTLLCIRIRESMAPGHVRPAAVRPGRRTACRRS
ncbi:MAG: phosphatase PAP2 family protein [Pigmentiphaga sp.]|uniref:phosphatase PAP2 family protein n=1 Tax=Pigmentiphaga sp. TaxID=1977564 RepID=UPI0029B02816|nr:phosphatase PAP2 family protein [Pigmentiphaga sp.]MDX3905873.1 phosphatase PAP2 family protein [Pigmentiphaga sp.]